jgi:hypothetical protein
MPLKKISYKNKLLSLRLIPQVFNPVYRFIGLMLMVIGTFVMIILGSLVLVWVEIIQIPKIITLTKEKFNISAPELIATES